MGDAEVLEHDALVARTTANQGRAAAPDASAWVSANAGTGKTYVLTQRVLRLLLDGCPPDQILCLTYTNAAAAEMSRRVFDRLATWSITPPEALASELESLVERRVDAALVRRAAVLFAQAIETPGGLKVQTIHSFCERLLQRFPLEAGVAPEFSILDEQAQRLLMAQCTDQVLDAAARGGDPLLTEALQRAIAYAGETQFDALLAAVLTRRVALTALIRGQGGAGEAGSAGEAGADVGLTDEAAFAAYEADLFRHLGASLDDTPETFAAAQAHLLSDQEIASAIDVLRGGGKKDKERADLLAGLAAIHDASQRAAIFRGAFLTQSGTPLSSILVKAQREAHPGVTDMLEDARDRLAALVEAEAAFDIARASSAIVRLADAIFERYAIVKAQRAVLDYDDLILKSAALLRVSSDAQWVLYKLDNGLAHILVDEAQDTSPLQWQIVAQLAQEFFSGTGMHECVRTLFAVGDEKQSIYGFQGARPEMFARMGGQFAAKAAAAGQTLNQVPLTLSFRTVAPVLEAVDRTFAEGVAREGLGSLGDPVRHEAFRAKEEGLVELWPLEEPDDAEPPAAWRPFEHRASTAPVDRVAQRIARTVRHWLDTGALIRPGGPAITPGDILVLVQRRSVVVPALIRALKAAGVPVAGADRIRLTEQLAVMDLMALGDFVLLPEDDLTLACVMKSPLIGLDDDDLLTLVDRKEKTLWASLLAARDDAPRYAVAAERLLRWRGRADFSPPFEFFSTVLGEDRIRADVLARLGPEAGDALDEFLARALQFDRDAPSSLRGFLTALRSANVEIKRDMDDVADEVRIMTVHGAKGLEAPIVFLPDTCRTPSAGIGPRVIDLDVAPKSPDAQATRSGKTSDVLEEARPFAWAVGTFAKVSAVEEAKTRDAALDAGEYRRLLYVAMTRARDRLYIAGYRGKNSPPKDCWYHLIEAGLEGDLITAEDFSGSDVRRTKGSFSQAGLASTQPFDTTPDVDASCDGLPGWIDRPVPDERVTSIPLRPSRIMPSEEETVGVQADAEKGGIDLPPVRSPLVAPEERRFQRGVLTHALLEHLPDIPAARQADAARTYVNRQGAQLPEHLRTSVVDEALAIVQAEEYSALFGPGSRAEVAIAADIPSPLPGGVAVRVNGTIDRVVVTDTHVHFVDYKTNRPPPLREDDVIEPYLVQLTAYRLALRQVYPDRSISASLLWTDGARMMTVPDAQLDAVEPTLFRAAQALEGASRSAYVSVMSDGG